MGATGAVLHERDWAAAERDFAGSKPWRFAVLDGLLEPAAARRLRDDLLAAPGWSRGKPPGLSRNERPAVPAEALGRELVLRLPHVLGGLALRAWWAHLFTGGRPPRAHWDTGDVTLNLWLTPDRHNTAPGTGGLTLYAAERTDRGGGVYLGHRAGGVDETALAELPARRVEHRCNRAVLFSARTLHAADASAFAARSPRSSRLSLTLSFG